MVRIERIIAPGIRNRIGIARLLIIAWPVSKNVSAEIVEIERLRENHVPQKTPATKAKSMTVKN